MSKEWLRATFKFIWETLEIVALALAIILPIRYFLATPFMVKGASMEPNFDDYQYLIIDEISYRFHEPQRGEVIVLQDPYKEHSHFIKRIIGLPNEKIEIKEGKVFIYNEEHPEGKALDEPYLKAGTEIRSANKKWELGPDEYFVLGDNRGVSLDSRYFGPITRDKITGRVWLRTFPFTKIEVFEPIRYNF